MKKRFLVLLLALIFALSMSAFAACDNDKNPSSTSNVTENSAEETAEESEEEDYSSLAYKATFTLGNNVTMYVYESQDYSATPTESTVAYSRDGESGDYLKDGTGQINFKLVFADGYELDDVDITGSFGNLKLPDEVGTDGVYRITKVAEDLTVSVTAKSESAAEYTDSAYAVNFALSDHVSIVIYTRQYLAETNSDDSGVSGTATGYARRDSTGALLTDGTGQINFKLIAETGYAVTSVSVTDGTYNKIKYPVDTETEDVYRITKIQTALEVTVEEIALEDAYTVTFAGDNFTVYVYDSQDVSVEGTVATVAYARNGDSGLIVASDGQMNFVIVPDEGYKISSVTKDGYIKNLKTIDETANVYRATKISGNATVTVVCEAE